MIPLIAFAVAMIVFIWAVSRSQSSTGHEWVRYQAIGVSALLIAGVIGALLQPGALRFAWGVFAIIALTRLLWLPKVERARGSSGSRSSGGV